MVRKKLKFVLQTEISGKYIQLFVYYSFTSVSIFSSYRKDQFAVFTFALEYFCSLLHPLRHFDGRETPGDEVVSKRHGDRLKSLFSLFFSEENSALKK